MTRRGGSGDLPEDQPEDLPEDQVDLPAPPELPAGVLRATGEEDDEEGDSRPARDSASALSRARTKDLASPIAATGVPPAPVIPLDYMAPQSPLRRLSVVLIVAIVVLMLWWGRPVLMPLAMAVLLSFLLSPLCDWLERRRVPRVVSVISVVLAAFLALGALGWAVVNGVQQLAANIERIGDNLTSKLDNLPFRGTGEQLQRVQETIEEVGQRLGDDGATRPATAPAPATQPAETQEEDEPELEPAEEALVAIRRMLEGMTSDEDAALRVGRQTEPAATRPAVAEEAGAEPVPVEVVPRPMTPWERTTYFLGIIAGPLGAAGLVIVFTLFILLRRDDLRDRVITVAAGPRLNLATQAIEDAATRIIKYLTAMAIVNGTYGLAVGVGLEVLAFVITGDHFPSVWLWALLCATLRFIPYLGPWVAAAFPLVVSIGWWPGYEMFIATALFIIVIELLSNNVMEPILYGSTTGMSPVAIILAAAFWTFVWGPMGLLIAVPLTTCLVVLGKYIPSLRFVDILLGDEPVLPPDARLYQRMLALDAEDAEDVVDEYRKENTLTDTFDNVILPALTLAERDRHAGHLTAERIDFIRTVTRELVTELGSQQEPARSDSVDLTAPPLPPVPPPGARIVILPSVDAADETAAMMLKALLERRGFEAIVVDEQELTSEKLEQVFSQRAEVAVISAVPPRAVARARYLVKRLRQAQTQRGEESQGTAAAAVVGLWTMSYDAGRAAKRLQGEGSDVRVVTKLGEAVEEIRQRAQVVTAKRSAGAAPGPAGTVPAPSPVSGANIQPAAR